MDSGLADQLGEHKFINLTDCVVIGFRDDSFQNNPSFTIKFRKSKLYIDNTMIFFKLQVLLRSFYGIS